MTKSKGFYLNSISFNDGTSIELERNSIVLITGPNNCGKSQTLKEIAHHPIASRKRIVTHDIKSTFDGDLEEIFAELLANPIIKQNKAHFEANMNMSQINPGMFLTLTATNYHFYQAVLAGFITYLGTINRLISFGVTQENTFTVSIQAFGLTPLGKLYEDQAIASKVYAHTKSAFGKGVLLNHATFQDQDLYFFDEEGKAAPHERGTSEYARWFEGQDKLNQQGDGINSFATILITLLQKTTPLALIDEPEAFLHPPQIRELARVIATETPQETQLIIATHSDDFLKGMMDYAGSRTSVVRMVRKSEKDGGINSITRLSSSDISQLWTDPLLKTSDVLSSLFHKTAVIVEGDSDARFFRAMLDATIDDGNRSLDIRFFHCGGKDRIPKIASALKAIGVSVVCIVDIDILDDKVKFTQLIESFGGDFSALESLFDEISNFVNQRRALPSGSHVKSRLEDLLKDADLTKPLPNDLSKKLSDAVKPPSVWAMAKQTGETFFTGGETFNNFRRICDTVESVGILINKVGELENFCRTISSKRKSEWLAEVLIYDLARHPALIEGRQFVERLLSACNNAS